MILKKHGCRWANRLLPISDKKGGSALPKKERRLGSPRPPKSCRFRPCDVYANEAFLILRVKFYTFL